MNEINAEYSKEIAKQVYLLYSKAQSVVLSDMTARAFKGIQEPNSWVERKNAEIIDIMSDLSKLTKKLNKETSYDKVAKMMCEAYEHGILAADKSYKVKGGTRYLSRALVNIATELSRSLHAANLQILPQVTNQYRELIAQAAANVASGVETVIQSTQRMLNSMSDRGVVTFQDKSGRNWNIASYAEMATRTASGNAMLQGHLDRQISMGRDLVLVSAHAGSCPLCSAYQGQILSISGTDKRYKSLSDAQLDGLFHPNCEHSITGYIEGVTQIITHNEAHFKSDQYKYIQQQRYNERQLRKWKNRQQVALTPTDRSKATTAIKSYQRAQRTLLNEYEQRYGQTLRRDYRREAINSGYKS